MKRRKTKTFRNPKAGRLKNSRIDLKGIGAWKTTFVGEIRKRAINKVTTRVIEKNLTWKRWREKMNYWSI